MLPAALLLRLATASIVWTLMDPERMMILPADQVSPMLHQCTRRVPAAGTGYWRPSAVTIAEMEGKVHDALPIARHPDQKPSPAFPHGYVRQYVGYYRDGRRYIYGNYEPDLLEVGDHWHRKAITICDGGPKIFGAEYNPSIHAISNLAFNNSI